MCPALLSTQAVFMLLFLSDDKNRFPLIGEILSTMYMCVYIPSQVDLLTTVKEMRRSIKQDDFVSSLAISFPTQIRYLQRESIRCL